MPLFYSGITGALAKFQELLMHSDSFSSQLEVGYLAAGGSSVTHWQAQPEV
jgi:hypothetical protein